MSVGLASMAVVVFAGLLVDLLSALEPLLGPTKGLQDQLGSLEGIAWPWYVLIGTTITVATGWLSSLTRRF